MFLPLWLVLSILTGLTSNLFNFLTRFLLKDDGDPTAFAWYMEFLRLIAFGFLAIFDWSLVLTPHSILLFILVGLTEFIGGYWYMKMHSYSELSISSILSRMRLVWIPIIAFFVIDERLLIYDYLGILIIFIGVSFVVAPRKLFIDKGARYASLTAFIIAINTVLIKMLIPYASPAVINTFMTLPSVLLFPLLMKNPKKRILSLREKNFPLKTFTVGLSVFQLYIFTLALRYGEASKVNAIAQGMMVFAVIAGIIFLRERKNIRRKLIGTVTTVIGVLLLTSI